jgi:hypothetical protein
MSRRRATTDEEGRSELRRRDVGISHDDIAVEDGSDELSMPASR